MADSTWLILREQGAIIEEADDNGEGGEGSLSTEDQFNEKDGLAEKIGLHLQTIKINAGLGLTGMEDNG